MGFVVKLWMHQGWSGVPGGQAGRMLGLSNREGTWWRPRFPALGVGLSSCFLLIERVDNVTVTQLQDRL